MSFSLFKDEKCSAFFQYLGLLVFSIGLLKSSLRIFNNLGTFFFGTGSVNLKKFGSWAVVTGCTDGIGKAYAEKLAKNGLNIVLISRTLDKLKEQAKYLEEKYSIQTKVIAANFTEPNSIYDEIKKQIEELDIAILINNVGISYTYPNYYSEICDNNFINDMVNCNIMSVSKMTAIVLPGMVKRKGGVIVNNASASGQMPIPMLALYSATKAFVDFFSRALNIENESKGIIVQSVCPYFVSTKLSGTRKSLTSPTPNEYVCNALKTIGTQSVTNGCLVHNIQGWIYSAIPSYLFNKVTLSVMLKSKAKAISKLKRKQETSGKKE